jgi:hypothetical protein
MSKHPKREIAETYFDTEIEVRNIPLPLVQEAFNKIHGFMNGPDVGNWPVATLHVHYDKLNEDDVERLEAFMAEWSWWFDVHIDLMTARQVMKDGTKERINGNWGSLAEYEQWMERSDKLTPRRARDKESMTVREYEKHLKSQKMQENHGQEEDNDGPEAQA